MAQIKKIVKALAPPVIFAFLKRLKKQAAPAEMWSGDYGDWASARRHCASYESDVILNTCKSALLKVKNNEAVYERDSVLFDEKQYSWGLLSGLQRAALEHNGRLSVLDFGGSLGSTYYQNRQFLSSIIGLEWCIVEQEHFVACGRQNFQNGELKFYYTVEDCLAQHRPNVLLLSSVIQYLEKPFEWLEKLAGLEIQYILIDRTAFVERDRDLLTVQQVPAEIYPASYPAWFFNETKFLGAFKNYTCLGQFESFCEPARTINGGQPVRWNGYLLKKRN